MGCDCHIHMVLDGADWKRAIARHSGGVQEAWVRRVLEVYQKLGFSYLRDGGDRWGVGAKARSLAGEYGITYRTPLSPLCAQGHYGGFIGEKYENLSEYAAKVSRKRTEAPVGPLPPNPQLRRFLYDGYVRIRKRKPRATSSSDCVRRLAPVPEGVRKHRSRATGYCGHLRHGAHR